MPAGTEMLPLIVGQIADQTAEDVVVDAEPIDVTEVELVEETAAK
jgi:hypothetical protein